MASGLSGEDVNDEEEMSSASVEEVETGAFPPSSSSDSDSDSDISYSDARSPSISTSTSASVS